jgi:glycosyltransferase involved in cell wall biosynthesis
MLGLKDHSTGGYSFNFRMAEALERAGHTVDIIHYTTISPKLRGSRARGSLRVLGAVLRDPPDLLVVSKSYSFMGPLRLLLPVLGIPVLYMVHHLEWHDREGGVPGSRRALVRWFISGGNRVWVNSGCTASDVVSLGIPSSRISVVPPGYDPFPVPLYSERKLPVRIISVGTVCPRKDQLTLLKSCAGLTDLDFQLHILGDESTDPDYSMRVRELADSSGLGSKVFFHGHLPLEELHRFYGSSHILANLSRWEGYGMAVVDALQSGLPVVAADAGAVPELIDHGVQGFLVPPGDSSAAMEYLRQLVSSGTLRNELSVNAVKRAAALFTWEKTEKEFIRLAESLCSNKEKSFG